MKLLNILIKKELIDAIRDKRSVMAVMWYAIGSPLLMCGLFFLLINKLASPSDLQITITNPQGAPDLIRYLENQDITHGTGKDLKAITLKISDDFAKEMNKGQPATVTLIADNSEQNLRSSISRLQRALQVYSSEMASLRLIARGINPTVVQPIKVVMEDQATKESKGSFIFGLAILSIIYAVFICGMNHAIDTSAGERERNSLTLLLSHPLSTRQIVLSKVLAVTTLAMTGLLLTLLVSKAAYTLVPWHELGFTIKVSFDFILFSCLLALPISIMASSLQLFASFFAKSFKEAQTYISFTLFVPMMLSIAITYDIAPDTLHWLPVSGQQQALMQFIKGKSIDMTPLLVSSAMTLLLAIGLILGMEKALKSEKTIFGL
ncbi:ABC transporter permease [Parashewanella tropica]|uniref:ABC transporter permease n=1 Tax=Parashewanella tropica TaxID=2547970 RepID=UPI003CCC6AC4